MPGTRSVPNSRAISEEIRLFNAGFKAGRGRPSAVLVKRFRGLGDVLQVLPALRALKGKYGPKTKLVFGTSPVFFPLLRRFDFIDRLVNEKQAEAKERYDLTVDLQNKVDFLPICCEAPRQDLFARLLELNPRCYRPRFNFPITKSEIGSARAILKRAGWRGEKLLGLHLTAYSTIRTWPVERNLELVERLSDREGWKILILESHAVREQFRKFDHVIVPDKTSIVDLLGLLSFCKGFVCPDSGPMHVAGLLRIPTVALFGPIPPGFRIGYYPQTTGLSLRVECNPCWDWQTHACHKKPHYRQCLKKITAEMVIETLEGAGCF